MKKIMIILCLICCCSCSSELTRQVTLTIPEHPWEQYSGRKLWYYLKWGTSLDDIQTKYMSDERKITLNVPLGRTIYFCAYPLGDMQCFGGAVSPHSFNNHVFLTQNRGVIANLFLNSDGKAAGFVDFDQLCRWADEICREEMGKSEMCIDYRGLNSGELLRDMLNGSISKKSLRLMKKAEVSSFALPNGVWISETDTMGRIITSGALFPAIELYSGVYRFWNVEADQELRIVVDDTGSIFHHVRQSEVPDNEVVYEK